MQRFASLFLIIVLLLSIGCSGVKTADSTGVAPTEETVSDAQSTPLPVPDDSTVDNEPTPTVVSVTLPTPEPLDIQEMRAEAKESMASAFQVLNLPQDLEVAATVNGEAIAMARFMDYLRVRLYSVTMSNGIDWSDANYEAYLPSFAREVLDVCVESVLLRQEARAQNVMPTEQEVREYRDDLVEQLKAAEEVDSQEAVLEVYEISLDTLTDLVTDTLIAQNLYALESSDTEEEQIEASHILVATEEEASEILARLDAGESFSDLAQELSLDTNTGANGGELGWFPRGAMVSSFEDAAFALEPGELSDVVETDYGFHIILLTDKDVRPLDETWAQLRQQQAFMDRLTTLESEATIEQYILTE